MSHTFQLHPPTNQAPHLSSSLRLLQSLVVVPPLDSYNPNQESTPIHLQQRLLQQAFHRKYVSHRLIDGLLSEHTYLHGTLA